MPIWELVLAVKPHTLFCVLFYIPHTLGLPAPVAVGPFEVFTSLLLLLFQPPTLLVVRFLLFGQEGAVLGLPELVDFVLDRAGRTGRAVVCRMQLGYGLIAVFCVEGFQVWGWVPLSATERF